MNFLWIRSQQASPASTGLQNEFRIIRARVPATFGYVSSQNRIVSPRNCKVKLVWLSAAALIGLVAFRAVLFSILFLGKCVYTDDTPAPDPILGRPHFLSSVFVLIICLILNSRTLNRRYDIYKWVCWAL